MPLSTPDFETIRGALLRDLQNLRADADVGPDSDFFVRASSVASAVEGLYQHQSWIARQIFRTAPTATTWNSMPACAASAASRRWRPRVSSS